MRSLVSSLGLAGLIIVDRFCVSFLDGGAGSFLVTHFSGGDFMYDSDFNAKIWVIGIVACFRSCFPPSFPCVCFSLCFGAFVACVDFFQVVCWGPCGACNHAPCNGSFESRCPGDHVP